MKQILISTKLLYRCSIIGRIHLYILFLQVKLSALHHNSAIQSTCIERTNDWLMTWYKEPTGCKWETRNAKQWLAHDTTAYTLNMCMHTLPWMQYSNTPNVRCVPPPSSPLPPHHLPSTPPSSPINLSCQKHAFSRILKKSVTDGRTDRPTDGQTLL